MAVSVTAWPSAGRVRRRDQDGPGGWTGLGVPMVAVPEYRRVKVAPSQASWLVGKSGMVNTGHWAWGTPRSESDLVGEGGDGQGCPERPGHQQVGGGGTSGVGRAVLGRHGLDRDRDT